MKYPRTKDGDELLARAVMHAALDAPIKNHDDGSSRAMYDLIVAYPDGRRAAAEVVSTRNKLALSLSAAISEIGYVRRPELARMWILLVDPDAHIKRLARATPDLLVRLERSGVDQLRRTPYDPWSPELKSLGVVSCWSHEPTDKHPPGFYLNPFPTGAWIGDGNDTVRACEDFLKETPDIAAKLSASDFGERHAVIIVTIDWLGPFSSIEGGALPTTPPTLPEGVDCLWMVILKKPPIRAVYWLGDGIWRDIIVTQEQLLALSDDGVA